MGLISGLLSLPVSGPLRVAGWLAGKITDMAEEEYYDPAKVQAQLMELETKLETGEISETEYEAAEEQLIQRLREIREYQARKSQAGR